MIVENISRVCGEKQISIFRLEKDTKIGNGTIKKWEKSSPKVSNLMKVAKYLGCTLDELTKE